jgi:hypothetical protein
MRYPRLLLASQAFDVNVDKLRVWRAAEAPRRRLARVLEAPRLAVALPDASIDGRDVVATGVDGDGSSAHGESEDAIQAFLYCSGE